MKSLRQVQHAMQAGILIGDASLIASACGVTLAERGVAIYMEGYRARLMEVLELDYPQLRTLLGAQEFAVLAQRYLQSQLSRTRSIRWFGQHFADFLARHPIDAAQPWLRDIARVEWALGEAFDAPDAAAVDRSRLTRVPPSAWSALRFTIHPAVRTLRLSWNTRALIAATTEGLPAPPPHAELNHILIWRHGLSVRHKSIDPEYRMALELLIDGASFGELCTLLAATHSATQTAARATELLTNWLDLGLICDFTVDRFSRGGRPR